MTSVLNERDEIKKQLMTTPTTETTPTVQNIDSLSPQETMTRPPDETTPTKVDTHMERELEEKSVSQSALLLLLLFTCLLFVCVYRRSCCRREQS